MYFKRCFVLILLNLFYLVYCFFSLVFNTLLITIKNLIFTQYIPLVSQIRVLKLINNTKNLISKATIILKYEKLNSILQRPLLSICHHLNNPVYVTRNGN